MGWWAGGLLETAGGWGWGWLVLGAVNPFRSAKQGLVGLGALALGWGGWRRATGLKLGWGVGLGEGAEL